MLESWIDRSHQSPARIDLLSKRWRTRPYAPLKITNFFSEHAFAELLECVRNIPNYQRDYSLLTHENEVRSVPYEEWCRTDPAKRWNSQDIARPLADLFSPSAFDDPKHLQTLRSFFQFAVLGDELICWLSKLIGVNLSKKVSCEFVHYREGDYITPHKDTHDDRIIGLNFYLGPEWRKGYGGELGFENEIGERFAVTPNPNTLSIIPIDEQCMHWVEPWRSKFSGRYTISMSFRPDSE